MKLRIGWPRSGIEIWLEGAIDEKAELIDARIPKTVYSPSTFAEGQVREREPPMILDFIGLERGWCFTPDNELHSTKDVHFARTTNRSEVFHRVEKDCWRCISRVTSDTP